MKQPCVYLLASHYHGTLYVGVTSDLVSRMHQHRSRSIQGHTLRYRIDRLVYFEDTEDVLSAIRREKQLKGWRRAKKVALTVDADDALIDAISRALSPDILQLHGKETPARAAALSARTGKQVMKAIGVSDRADLAVVPAYAEVGDFLLLDAKPPKDATRPGGNGLPFDWSILDRFDPGKPWLLSGGLDAGNVAEALARTHAPGVDVSSGVESAPGMKDDAKIRAFVAAARALP